MSPKSIATCCLIVVYSMILFSCGNKRQDIMALVPKAVYPAQSGKGITMLWSDSTVLKIKLKAPVMTKYEKGVKEPVTILPKGVDVVFYDEAGKPATTLKANYGIMYDQTQRMEVRYNVEVVNVNGEKLNTEHLVWDEQKKQIVSDAFVKITTAREIIMGNGLVSNQDFTQYEIRQVTGTVRIQDKDL
jgi:LPS export ABC transporter protein LptC